MSSLAVATPAQSPSTVEDRERCCATCQTMQRELGDLKTLNATLIHARIAAEAASLAKSRYLADIRDEIRTPLNALVGMSGILADTRLDPNQQQITRAIESSGRALSCLLGDVLELASIDADGLNLDIRPLDLDDMAASLERSFAPLMTAKGLSFEVRTSMPSEGVALVGDPSRVRQLVGRLLASALKATDSGAVTLHIDVGADGGAAFTVTDTAAITDDRPRLQQPADLQRHAAVAAGHRGLDLGLAVGRSLAEAMQGSIETEARPGEGGRVTVFLPLATEAKPA